MANEEGIRGQRYGESCGSICFSDGSDADRVLLGKPWSYDKYLVSLRRLEKNVTVRDLVSIERPFGYKSMTYLWVR